MKDFKFMNFKFLMILLLLLIATPLALAHLAGGVDATVDNHIVDIGYDAEQLTAGRSTVFLLSLKEAETEEAVTTNNLWIKLQDTDKNTLFSGKIFPEPTGTYGFTILFPEEGRYTLSARFSGAETFEVEHSEVLTVARDLNHKLGIDWLKWLLLSLLLLIIVLMICRNKNKLRGEK